MCDTEHLKGGLTKLASLRELRETRVTLSPSVGVGIGMAYLPCDIAQVGTAVSVEVRGRMIPAEVSKKPFYKKA